MYYDLNVSMRKRRLTLPCDYALDIVLLSVGGLSSCPIIHYSISHYYDIFGTLNFFRYH